MYESSLSDYFFFNVNQTVIMFGQSQQTTGTFNKFSQPIRIRSNQDKARENARNSDSAQFVPDWLKTRAHVRCHCWSTLHDLVLSKVYNHHYTLHRIQQVREPKQTQLDSQSTKTLV